MSKKFPISTKGGSNAEWIGVAEKVVRVEFLKADKTTVESLIIGMRRNPDPRCQQAVLILKPT